MKHGELHRVRPELAREELGELDVRLVALELDLDVEAPAGDPVRNPLVQELAEHLAVEG